MENATFLNRRLRCGAFRLSVAQKSGGKRDFSEPSTLLRSVTPERRADQSKSATVRRGVACSDGQMSRRLQPWKA